MAERTWSPEPWEQKPTQDYEPDYYHWNEECGAYVNIADAQGNPVEGKPCYDEAGWCDAADAARTVDCVNAMTGVVPVKKGARVRELLEAYRSLLRLAAADGWAVPSAVAVAGTSFALLEDVEEEA